jgi:hypothetical protein
MLIQKTLPMVKYPVQLLPTNKHLVGPAKTARRNGMTGSYWKNAENEQRMSRPMSLPSDFGSTHKFSTEKAHSYPDLFTGLHCTREQTTNKI